MSTIIFHTHINRTCLTNVSNTGCIIIMSDKIYLHVPTCLSVCPSFQYLFLQGTSKRERKEEKNVGLNRKKKNKQTKNS